MSPSMAYDYDLFVIGGGSGGVRASRMSASFGAKVGLAEESRLGGTCVNLGCVPKKLLVYGASYAEDFVDAAGYGWTVPKPRFDWGTLLANKDAEIARLNGIYGSILEKAGVEVFPERAVLEGPHELRVGDRKITAETILIATGGRPWVADIEGADLGIVSDDVFSLPALPKRVVIAGGGYIGLEFASVFNALGSEVHLVHKHEHVLNAFDRDVSKLLEEQMRLRGVHMHLGQTIEKIEKRGAHLVALLANGDELEGDVQLAAIGRRPNTAGLGLEAAGVEVGARGAIVVDDELRTSQSNIYALGDVIDRVALTPVALAEGMAFAKSKYGEQPTTVDYTNIPTAVFSIPQVGTVGLGEEAAWHRGEVVEVFKSTFRPMRHTLSGRHEKTLMKLVVCRNSDRVLGCHMVGPDAAEITQGLAIALKCGATKAELDATLGIHPSAAEEFVTMRTPVE